MDEKLRMVDDGGGPRGSARAWPWPAGLSAEPCVVVGSGDRRHARAAHP